MEAEGLDGKSITFYPSSFGTRTVRCPSQTSVFPAAISPESFQPYVANSSANGAFTFGCYFGNSCCGCELPQNVVLQPSVMEPNENGLVNGQSAKKLLDMTVSSSSMQHYGDSSCRLQELAFCQGCTASYPRISAYVDLPVVHRAATRDPRHETCLPMEGHQPWDWSNNWNSQLNGSKYQTQRLWKPSLTEGTTTSFYQRGRKKRVPYTNLQLKALECEYTNTKFITKEKRRRIASSTNLSERQVTIWFQNRRVKDKKRIPSTSKPFKSC